MRVGFVYGGPGEMIAVVRSNLGFGEMAYEWRVAEGVVSDPQAANVTRLAAALRRIDPCIIKLTIMLPGSPDGLARLQIVTTALWVEICDAVVAAVAEATGEQIEVTVQLSLAASRNSDELKALELYLRH